MNDLLTSEDPRYKELFDITKEVAGDKIYGDLTPQMNALRERAPVQKGSLRELLGVPAVHMAYDTPRQHYTLFTFALCDRALRENLLFSSEVYNERPGVNSIGHASLRLTGNQYRCLRAGAQPTSIPPPAAGW